MNNSMEVSVVFSDVLDDVCSMQFPDEHFDAAIDKGTMDTLMVRAS
jgi:hypothetical protein